MKYLSLYKKWLIHGMPNLGLCLSIPGDNYNLFSLIEPTTNDLKMLRKKHKSRMYWASDSGGWMTHQFNPLRQNLVLLLAAMNGEL